jgi:hypothetical protein
VTARRLALIVLDALEAGDTHTAEAAALAALEDGSIYDPDGRRKVCRDCGAGPMWPGELAAHTHVRRAA